MFVVLKFSIYICISALYLNSDAVYNLILLATADNIVFPVNVVTPAPGEKN